MANNVLHSLGETLASPFWKDNVFTRLKVTGKHGQDACDPLKVQMAGRRTSTFKPVKFSKSITASQVLHDSGCDFFRKYTDTQIRIGWCAKVFPLHTDFFLSAYLFCIILISL
jgi:hypothetical protein